MITVALGRASPYRQFRADEAGRPGPRFRNMSRPSCAYHSAVQPVAPEWTMSVWLVAVGEAVAPDEAHRYWNGKDTPVLDAILERSPALLAGTTEVTLPENEGLRGPVGRLHDLILLRGTTPEYLLPLIDNELTTELAACLAPDPADPDFQVIPTHELVAFLNDHAGKRLATRSRLVNER